MCVPPEPVQVPTSMIGNTMAFLEGVATVLSQSSAGSAASASEQKKKELNLAQGRGPEGHVIFNSLRQQQPVVAAAAGDDDSDKKSKKEKLLIGIQGDWFDVTSYVPHHPGGDILLDFVGKDATMQFLAYHDKKTVLKHRKPVGTYDYKPKMEAMDEDWLKLNEKYEKLGYFKPSPLFMASRFAILFAFMAGTGLCVHQYLQTANMLVFFIGSVLLAGVGQQSGFLMHDAMHNILFHNRKVDQSFGWVFANVIMGLSSKWWRDEHNEHHVFTNTHVEGVGATDSQMMEDAWVQDIRLTPYWFGTLPPHMQVFAAYHQHQYYVPALVSVGPYLIRVASFTREKRIFEKIGICLYACWVAALISVFPTFKEGLTFYAISMTFFGVLSIQLVISHYSKPWREKATTIESGWSKRQIEAVLDISCNPWLDWFFGGLHIHSVHHVFPRMNRAYYRQVHPEMIELCKKHNVELDIKTFGEAIRATIGHLKDCGVELQNMLKEKDRVDKKLN